MATTVSLRQLWFLERKLLQGLDPAELLEVDERVICVLCESVFPESGNCECDNDG